MVNANQARPLAAFWLLALVAAVITGAGLLGDGSGSQTRPGSPVSGPSSVAPELVLGGVLRGQPGASVTSPLSPDLWLPATVVEAPAGAVQVSGPESPGTGAKARTRSGAHGTTTSAKTPVTATPTTSATDHGKGRHKDRPAKSTTTASATTEPTGNGKGVGRPVVPGKH
jgi:hypothetical protein